MGIRLEDLTFRSSETIKLKYCKKWLSQLLARVPFRFKINLLDQEFIDNFPESKTPAFITLTIKHPGVLKHLFLSGDPLLLGEAYAKGLVDIKGKLEGLIDLASYLDTSVVKKENYLALLAEILLLPNLNFQNSNHLDFWSRHTLQKDKSSIQHHYDVGNDFYKLWLDKHLVYSCAHFESEQTSLSKAQEAKLDLICKKLRLQPGETLLDVGCGWGALLRWAVNNYGVKGYGITLSQEQYDFNQKQIETGKLSDKMKVNLIDYRSLPTDTMFDKIVSVGMIEHIGVKNYNTYFRRLLAALKPGGLLLNHGIITNSRWDPNAPAERFIDKYIFPNGELTRLSKTIESMEESGWEVIDVDSWRPHYAKTLRAWSKNLAKHAKEATTLIGTEKMRLWQLYLIGSACAFEQNHLGICQVLARRDCDKIWTEPLSRTGWLC